MHLACRRRDEHSVPRSASAEPDLRAANVAGGLSSSARVGEQRLVHVGNEPRRKRQPASEIREASIESGDTATDLACVVDWYARLFVNLVKEQVGERRLRSFDLRREHRLLSDEAVEEEGGVGKVRGDGVEPAEGDECVIKAAAERRGPDQRRLWRQGHRDESLEGFVGGGNADVAAWRSAVHEGQEPKIRVTVILG